MLTFDDLTLAGSLIFDNLDDSAVVAYRQQGDAAIVLSPSASQETSQVYEHLFDPELTIEASSIQEWLAPSAAVAYLQSGNAQIVVFASSIQEHVPVFGGTFGQSGNAQLALAPSAYQQWFAGFGTDFFQQADAAVTLSAGGAQIWDPFVISHVAYLTLQGVAAFAADEPTDVQASFAPLATVSQVRLFFGSQDPDWTAGVGPHGGAMGVEVQVHHNAQWVPLVSLSVDYPTAVFYTGERFDALSEAVATGAPQFRLGAFESAEDRVYPRSLVGTAVMALEAVS